MKRRGSQENGEMDDNTLAELLASSSESDKRLYRALLDHATDSGWDEIGRVVVYRIADGTYRFSDADPLQTLMKVVQEARFSDRLLVIVSVAYLEDQLRLLLAKFLVKDKRTESLLDPNGGVITSFLPMAKVALALGLLATPWYELLKLMAELRNKFAHIPSATSFEELTRHDEKVIKLIDKLKDHGMQQGIILESDESFKDFFPQLFLYLHMMLQFCTDHASTVNQRVPLDEKVIQETRILQGFTFSGLKQFLGE